MTGSHHPGDTLQDWLDGRLSARESESVERHLRDCERCRRERDRLRWARDAARQSDVVETMPEGLAERLTAALDAEDAEQPRETGRSPGAGRRLLWAGLAAAVLLVALIALWPSERMDLPESLARDFAAYRSGTLELEIHSADVREVERRLGRRLDFEVRVFDLAMMEYLPEGGRVHEVGDEPSALFVYRGADGQVLVCQMFRGRLEALPEAEERRTNDGIEFRVYERDGNTVVAWQEGEVVCVLVSDIAREQVIQLAFAKAVKVA